MTRKYRLIAASLAITAGWLASAASAQAADLPTFKLEMNDGKLNPARIEVPAGVRIKIEVHNIGKGAAEFESIQLRKEKVLAPGADSFVVIAPLDKGEYKFFDDFHQSAQGVIVAK
ncbi:inactive ferrous ion transporter periplasmic protein EfeO [Caballeronia sordidicola]|uniref:Inactive ferrous ion transporter periplasmic protein EfeO n=1 Tax=Caballeronia sordidicola TaxID=196367 RepID=A0A158GAU9_CABSO|nr:cupredoxin domain-containing protein [Caballeronia sordidicola]SAL29245.1 inactive ferrous ion transporter periplasmic protein EfeO [Caballeronia sordidicola]